MEVQEIKLLRNGVEVQLKNPGTDGLVDFLKLAKSMSKIPKNTKEDEFLSYLDDEALKSFQNLIKLTLKKTYINPTEEDDAWAMENSMMMFSKIMNMCTPKNITNDAERKEKLLNRLNNDKSTTKNTE